MPEEGETMITYCSKCQRDTTWIYCIFMLGKEIWECKDCGSRRLV